MKFRIRLSDADRQRLGSPEWLEYDPLPADIREAMALQKHGYKTPWDLMSALAAQYTEDEAENRVVNHIDWEAWLAIVWVALYRAGVKVDYDELTFDLHGLESDFVGDEEVEAGKDPSTPETSSTPSNT